MTQKPRVLLVDEDSTEVGRREAMSGLPGRSGQASWSIIGLSSRPELAGSTATITVPGLTLPFEDGGALAWSDLLLDVVVRGIGVARRVDKRLHDMAVAGGGQRVVHDGARPRFECRHPVQLAQPGGRLGCRRHHPGRRRDGRPLPDICDLEIDQLIVLRRVEADILDLQVRRLPAERLPPERSPGHRCWRSWCRARTIWKERERQEQCGGGGTLWQPAGHASSDGRVGLREWLATACMRVG